MAFLILPIKSTQYPANKTAVTVDVLEAGFTLAFVMLVFRSGKMTPKLHHYPE